MGVGRRLKTKSSLANLAGESQRAIPDTGDIIDQAARHLHDRRGGKSIRRGALDRKPGIQTPIRPAVATATTRAAATKKTEVATSATRPVLASVCSVIFRSFLGAAEDPGLNLYGV